MRIAGVPRVVLPTRVLDYNSSQGASTWINVDINTSGRRHGSSLSVGGGDIASLIVGGPRVLTSPYLVSGMFRCDDSAQISFGPLIDTGSLWQRRSWIWRSPANQNGTNWSVQIYKGSTTLLQFDDITVDRIPKLHYAQWNDWAVGMQGAVARPILNVDTTYLPRVRAVLRDGGVLRVYQIGDSICQGLSWAALDALIERAVPGVTVEISNTSIGSSGSAVWDAVDKTFLYTLNPPPTLLAFLTYSDAFNETTRAFWNSLLTQLKTNMPNTDILISSRLLHGNGESSAFAQSVATANQVGFWDADGAYRDWKLDGGVMLFPPTDPIHPTNLGREVLAALGVEWYKRIALQG